MQCKLWTGRSVGTLWHLFNDSVRSSNSSARELCRQSNVPFCNVGARRRSLIFFALGVACILHHFVRPHFGCNSATSSIADWRDRSIGFSSARLNESLSSWKESIRSAIWSPALGRAYGNTNPTIHCSGDRRRVSRWDLHRDGRPGKKATVFPEEMNGRLVNFTMTYTASCVRHRQRMASLAYGPPTFDLFSYSRKMAKKFQTCKFF